MANPIYEQTSGNYGSAPYHESAYKAALRNLLSNIGPAMSGLSAVPRGANFGDAFLAAAGASSRAVGASQQAAHEYAMKQQQAQEEKDFREYQKMHLEAQTDALRRPPPPEKPEKLEPWQRPRTEQDQILDYEKRHKIATTPPEKPGKPEKPDRTQLLDTNTLMDNFRQEKDVQNYTVVRDNTRRIESALKQGTGFGDLSAIFAFMKVLDPTSVVRETEFKNAEEASGWLQRTLAIPGKVVSGNRLTPLARQKILTMTKQLHDTQKQTYDRTAKRYKGMAQKFGVDPASIITDYEDSPAAGDPLGIR